MRNSLLCFICLLSFSQVADATCSNWALVTNSGGSSLVTIDLNDPPTSLSPNLMLPELFPLGIAVDAEGQFAYLACSGSNNVSVIDLSGDTPVHHGTLANPGTGARMIATYAQFVYVLNLASKDISVIDLTGSISSYTIPLPMGTVLPQFMALSPDGQTAYVTDSVANKVYEVPLSGMSSASIISLPVALSQPLGITVSSDGLFAYIANALSNNVTAVDLGTPASSFNIPAMGGLSGVAQPVAVAATAQGHLLCVANANSANMTVIDLDSLATTNITTGTSPNSVAITSDSHFAYVVNSGGTKSVSKIDLTMLMMPAETISVPMGTVALAYIALVNCPSNPEPIGVGGMAKKNSYFFQTDLYNVITWTAPTGFDSEFYQIYQNGSLVGQVDAGIYSFESHYLKSQTVYNYTIVAVNSSGETLEVGSIAIETKKG